MVELDLRHTLPPHSPRRRFRRPLHVAVNDLRHVRTWQLALSIAHDFSYPSQRCARALASRNDRNLTPGIRFHCPCRTAVHGARQTRARFRASTHRKLRPHVPLRLGETSSPGSAPSDTESWGSDLGFSRADRETNVRRLGTIARVLSENGDVVIVAAISPYRSAVREVRFGHWAPFIEVFVDCGIDELIRRDTKGLYQKALRGELSNLSGISAPYEPPPTPEVHVKTDRESVEESVSKVWGCLRQRGLVPN